MAIIEWFKKQFKIYGLKRSRKSLIKCLKELYAADAMLIEAVREYHGCIENEYNGTTPPAIIKARESLDESRKLQAQINLQIIKTTELIERIENHSH